MSEPLTHMQRGAMALCHTNRWPAKDGRLTTHWRSVNCKRCWTRGMDSGTAVLAIGKDRRQATPVAGEEKP